MSSAGNYILKATLTLVFFANFAKLHRKPFLQNTTRRILLGFNKITAILLNETRKMDGENFKDTAQVLQKIFDLLSRHFSSCAWM